MTRFATPFRIIEVLERAPAKINLALHVVGRRTDGYHELDSIVAFATVADEIEAAPAVADDFSVSGPGSKHLADGPGNLVLLARDRLRAHLGACGLSAPPVSLRLVKRLPVAGGIGGGSADAAATLRALVRLWEAPVRLEELSALALSLGADVPMCLTGRPARVRGIGERLTPLAPFPSLDMVLVNPGVAVSTPAVFSALTERENPPLDCPEAWGTAAQTVAALSRMRNDLEAAARSIAPEIGSALEALRATDALLVRMSGSGATCFGLYAKAEGARRAALEIAARHRRWYVTVCRSCYGVESHRSLKAMS